jgi:alkylation response protein AidB-like acyl-CoA dehydrogenase
MRSMLDQSLPLPGGGETPLRHRRLMEIGRDDLSLARLAEAHWDAVAILAETGRKPEPGTIYGVWASEVPGKSIRLEPVANGYRFSGTKMFCSGAGLIDRALVSVSNPEELLVDLDLRGRDLREHGDAIRFETSGWHTAAFELTNTATATFTDVFVSHDSLVGEQDWYSSRPGFWHGACGPAACWAGGAASLVDWAVEQRRDDAHALAHLGAMQASVWGLEAVLETAGREIDAGIESASSAKRRALTVRHLIEQACTDILRRLTRAYGPYPLAFVEPVARQYGELDLYLRQSHAERDLEKLGREGRTPSADG